MKKLFTLIMGILLVCVCSVTACAEEAQYATAGALYQGWANHLPDYVCGVWSTDGGTTNLTFGIQNNEAGEAGKQEILALVADDSTVSFAYQEFTRNYLYEIFQELHVYFEQDIGLVILGVSDTDNRVTLEILEEKQQDPKTRTAVLEIIGKYGRAVEIEYIDKRLVPTAEVGEVAPIQLMPYTPEAMLFPVVVTLVLLCAVFVILIRRKMLTQTNNGTIVSATQPPSAKEVEAMVKKSDPDIPSQLRQKVMDAINETPPTK